MTQEPDAVRRGRRYLLWIAAIFAAPVLLAILLNSSLLGYHPAAEENRGRLLQPPLHMESGRSVVTSAGLINLDQEPTQWWLLAIEEADCATACQQRLQELDHLRRAMGRRSGQVPAVVVTRGMIRGLAPELAQRLYFASMEDNPSLAKVLRRALLTDHLPVGQRFIVNLGWVMMTYPPDQPNTDVLEDLKLLTRTRPGR